MSDFYFVLVFIGYIMAMCFTYKYCETMRLFSASDADIVWGVLWPIFWPCYIASQLGKFVAFLLDA